MTLAARLGGIASVDGLEDLLYDFDGWIAQHGKDWAEDRLRRRYPNEAGLVLREFAIRIGKPVVGGLVTPDLEPWYLPKADRDMPRWSFAKSHLGLPAEVVARTGEVADKILARLADPRGPDIRTRGLVLGHVQV